MSDTVKSWIEERRNQRYMRDTNVMDAFQELPHALTALEAVIELHKPNEIGECPHCGHDSQGSAIEWPCATVQAIEGAINHE